MAVHAPGEDRLRMEGVDQVDALVIGLVAEPVGAVEDDVSGARAQARRVEDARQLDAVPFADRAPPFDAIVARDLHAVRHRLRRVAAGSTAAARPGRRPPAASWRNSRRDAAHIRGVPGMRRAVRAEDRRQIGFAIFAGERIARARSAAALSIVSFSADRRTPRNSGLLLSRSQPPSSSPDAPVAMKRRRRSSVSLFPAARGSGR